MSRDQVPEERVVVEVARRGKLVVGEPFFTPGTPLMLDRKGLGDAGPGDLVVARRTRGRARVERVLGAADRIENVLEALLVERGARQEFEPFAPPPVTTEGRVDLRELPTFTIDPETAKDFDDALSIDEERAYVHIADVSYFVTAGSPLDGGAARRGFSTYVPGLVAPMLPHDLADDLCSLRPQRRPAVRHRRAAAGRERAVVLPLRDPQRRAPVVRPGAADPRRRRGLAARGRSAAPGRAARASFDAGGSRAERSASRPRRSSSSSTGAEASRRRAGRASRSRTRSSRSS